MVYERFSLQTSLLPLLPSIGHVDKKSQTLCFPLGKERVKLYVQCPELLQDPIPEYLPLSCQSQLGPPQSSSLGENGNGSLGWQTP